MSFEMQPAGAILNGRYRLIRLIRSGGMGAAYEAEDQVRGGKRVVVKELTDTFESAEERQLGIRNFLAEVQVLAGLSHPHIPRMFDHFFNGDHFYFVMELIDGMDLEGMLKERGRIGFSPAEVVAWGLDVCHVLEYIHSFTPPLIHRDIKPSNLMRRNKDGKLFVLDFGIARVARPKEGKMIGTLGYASPEQHENRLEPRSDIYSLGVTMHELLTGLEPEPYQFTFEPPSVVNPEISGALSECVMKAISYYPEERWESALQFCNALEGLEEYTSHLLAINNKIKDADGEHSFILAVGEYYSAHLAPLLEQVRLQFQHECQTNLIPKELVYFEFVLGVLTPFKLIVILDEDSRKIIFKEQEGILSPRLLGEIFPLRKETWQNDMLIISEFTSHFEENASSGGFSLYS